MSDSSQAPSATVDVLPPSGMAKARRWVGQTVQTARFWLFVMLLLVGAYIVLVVRPFDDHSFKSLTGDDIAQAWNEGIGRLGIISVYPPQEDLRVGDIWAVVVQDQTTPILGKSVRIGRIDFRNEILEGDADRPLFPETTEVSAGQPYRRSDPLEVPGKENPNKRISTSIAAFPFITINHAGSSGGTAGWSWFGLGGSSALQQIEQIRIKGVESYGVPVMPAYGMFHEWCAAEKTKIICEDDAVARNLLAVTVSSDVLKHENNQYLTRIQLRLITRVFMTREIESRRWNVDSRGAILQVTADPKSAELRVPIEGAKPPETAKGADGTAPLAAITQAANPGSGGQAAKISSLRSDELEVGVSGVFQRPIVFGYRAIITELTPAKPPASGIAAK